MDICFVLLGTHQHCVAKICDTSPANAHKLTRSHQVPYFKLTCAPKHALPHPVFRGARRLVSRTQRNATSRTQRVFWGSILFSVAWYKYTLSDVLRVNTRWYFTSYVVFFRAPQGWGQMPAMSKMFCAYYLAKHPIRGLLFRLNFNLCHQASIFFSKRTESGNFLILHTASVSFI